MNSEVKPRLGTRIWAGIAGMTRRRDWPATGTSGNPGIRLIALPVIAVTGFLVWGLFAAPSDAENQSTPATSATAPIAAAPNSSLIDPAATPTNATEASPADENAAPADTASVDGLKISSQFWRRGGLGSNALVTFTLRNRNEYAVRDIEISCAFTRSDGSHLTDRTRLIHDTVNMKSRKTFARMHVGFVNVNADKAKCALVGASRV